MQYKYVAVDKKGHRIKGMLDAVSESEARVSLRSQQLRPIKLDKAGALELDLGSILKSKQVRRADLLVFSRQLSILISSGVPLVQGLDIIAEQIRDAQFKSVILSIKEKVTGGKFLWESVADHKNAFPEIYVSLIRAGEATGSLDVILKRLIKYLEDSEKLKKLVQGALIYPIAVILVGVLVVGVMMTFVIPKFEKLLKSSNQELPDATQMVITVSHFFQNNIAFIVGGIVAATYLFRRYVNTEEGRKFFDYTVIKIPLFGDIILKVSVARFARTLQTLLSSGITILDAMDICKSVIGNKTLERGLGVIKSDLEQGKSLSATMSKIEFFPAMVIQMITVGESTGNVDKMLEKIADFYEEEVQGLVSGITKLIEPFVLVFLGGIVGALMIAMYLPMFKMAGG